MRDAVIRRGSRTFEADVVHHLALSGFCLVDSELDDELLRKANDDAQRIDRFIPPPPLIVEGLLGAEGSSEVAELEHPGISQAERTDGASLHEIDSFMTEVAVTLEAFFQGGLGFECGDRTLGLLHKCGASYEDPSALTEKVAGKWLNIFRRQRVMCVVCLSRRGGTFTLEPNDGESEPEAVHVKCGDLLLLRADVLSRSFQSDDDGGMTLSCFFLQKNTSSGVRGAFVDDRLRAPAIPVVEDLVHWADSRLELIKHRQETAPGSLEDMEIPRSWKMLASHTVTKGPQIMVRGIATHVAHGCERPGKHICALSIGVDLATEVPISRWDHRQQYDPDPMCWMDKELSRGRVRTNINHAAFIEGIDMFDNKFFGMSIMESKVTDPTQRLALEHAYEALHMAGYVKKKLLQSFIGVYQGHTASDWDKIEHETGAAAGAYSPTIASNRISFALGLMGPSFTIDLEGAASLAAIYQGCHDLLPSDDFRKPLTAAGLAGGVTMNLSWYWWPVHNQFMNPVGRCFTFDEKANGYIKGEGSSLVVLKRHAETVEGKLVVEEGGVPSLGTVSGWAMANSGRTATLSAPSAPALRQVVNECVHYASISPLDVDAVQVDGKGNLMNDAVELVSLMKELRDLPGGDEEVLVLDAAKTKLGFCQETAGVAAFVSAIMASRHGHIPGALHLKSLNPHAQVDDDELQPHVPTEAVQFRCRQSFNGVTAYGMGGSNVHTLVWNQLSESAWPSSRTAEERPAIAFWPGGGGELEDSEKPKQGYSIVGSWACWDRPETMKESPHEEGVFVFDVPLGDNRFEDFQIWIDGDSEKVLCPGGAAAGSGARVMGPMPLDECDGRNWRLDGRPQAQPLRLSGAPDAVDGVQDVLNDDPLVGLPGDRYQIELRIAGKWKTVLWRRTGTVDLSRSRGRYFVACSWRNWAFDEMVYDPTAGIHYLAHLKPPSFTPGEFRIVRNKDWAQTFVPGPPGDGSSEVLGPVGPTDVEFHAHSWKLAGGVTVRIEFQREIKGESEKRKVSWRSLDQ